MLMTTERHHFSFFFWSVSILETNISNESDKNAEALRLAMGSTGSDTSELDNITTDYYEKFNNRLNTTRSSMKKPNPKKLGDAIKNILLTPKPHFRYQINRICKQAARSKLTETEGDAFIKEAVMKYFPNDDWTASYF